VPSLQSLGTGPVGSPYIGGTDTLEGKQDWPRHYGAGPQSVEGETFPEGSPSIFRPPSAMGRFHFYHANYHQAETTNIPPLAAFILFFSGKSWNPARVGEPAQKSAFSEQTAEL
jgi:hypothetical protein